MNRFKILVLGCGELGSRHLQAVASLPIVEKIIVVDPSAKAIALGQQRLQEVRPSVASLEWTSSLEEVKTNCDLCIVATQARGRCQLIKNAAEKIEVRRFLIEKIVAQSSDEYTDLLEFVRKHPLSVWVNCKGRAHPSHRMVKQNLKEGEPIVFTAVGGNHGLANNGIHAADLFSFFSSANEIKLAFARIDPVLHPSKRGEDIFDLSGVLHGYTEGGSQFLLSFTGPSGGPAHFSISTPSYRAFVDDFMKWFYESKRETEWIWKKVPYEADLTVSHMTKKFATDILQNRGCELPTLEECWPAHRFILESLEPHFNRLLRKDLGYCPVT